MNYPQIDESIFFSDFQFIVDLHSMFSAKKALIIHCERCSLIIPCDFGRKKNAKLIGSSR